MERAQRAVHQGDFADEIVPVTVSDRSGERVVDTDEHPRADTTVEALARLKPILAVQDPEATVTAGNSSGQNDAASMCIVTTLEKAADLGLSLNAAWLWELRGCAGRADPHARCLLVLSGRVPPRVAGELFAKTGWEADLCFAAPRPVLQVRR